MTIAVTGAGGLLGTKAVQEILRTTQHDVLAISSQHPDQLADLWQLSRSYARVRFTTPSDFFRDPLIQGRLTAVINSAWPLNLGGAALAQGLDFHSKLFRAVETARPGAFVNVSSQSVYDSSRSYAANERSPLDLDTPYAAGKYACEIMADAMIGSVPTVHARMSSLIAPNFDRRLVNKMTRTALETATVRLTGPKQVFDFMDTRDAAAALVAIGASPEGAPSVVNIGAQAPMTLHDIGLSVARSVTARTGTAVELEIDDDGRAFSSELDVTRLRTHWNFTTEYAVQDTIDSVIESRMSACT